MAEDAIGSDIADGVVLLSPGGTAPVDMSGGRERILARLLIDRRVLAGLARAGAGFARLVEGSRVGTSEARFSFQPWPAPALDATAAAGLVKTFREGPDGLDVVEALIADAASRRLSSRRS